MKLSIVSQEEKYEKVKLVDPDMIYNRFDIKYSGDFDVVKIKYFNKEQYIAFHIDEQNVCYVGIYMTKIKQRTFDKMLIFLKKKYKNIAYFHITQSLIKSNELDNKVHWLLELPKTVDEYWAQFSSKTRSERRRKIKKLKQQYNTEFLHYTGLEINSDLIKRFFELKTQTETQIYYDTDEQGVEQMLSKDTNITDAYIIKINGKIEAIEMCSLTGDKDAYFINLTYNTEYSGIGMMAYYYAIEQLIERGFKRIYLGGGNYKYKKECKAIKSETMSGDMNTKSPIQMFMDKFIQCTDEKNHKIVKIFGIKFKYKNEKKAFSKFKILRKHFVNANVIGSGNKIRTFYRGRWHNIKIKHPDNEFWIKGNNNIINFHFKTKKFPKGLKLTVNGSKNIIDIYKCTFDNTYIQVFRNKNVFKLKEQASAVADAHMYVGYGGYMLIGKNCELGNGGLELAVAGDYTEKHKMVIGDHTHIAKDTIIRTSDGQSLIDPETNLPTDPPEDVIIGNHVWIMSRCIILKGSHIPDGCAVAANSLVNKKFDEENLLLCGTPAKIMKRNIRWGSPYGKYMEKLAKQRAKLEQELKQQQK